MKVYIRYVRPTVLNETRSYILLTFDPSTSINQQLEDNFKSTINKTVGSFRGQLEVGNPIDEVITELQEKKPAINRGNTRSIFVNYKTGNSILSQGYTINEILNHCLSFFSSKGFEALLDPEIKKNLQQAFDNACQLLHVKESTAAIKSPEAPKTQQEFDLRFEALEAITKGLYTETFAEFYRLEGFGKLKSIDQLLDPMTAKMSVDKTKFESKSNGSPFRSKMIFMPAPSSPSIPETTAITPAGDTQTLLKPLLENIEKDEQDLTKENTGCHCKCVIQ